MNCLLMQNDIYIYIFFSLLLIVVCCCNSGKAALFLKAQVFFSFLKYLFIYLVVSGLSGGTWAPEHMGLVSEVLGLSCHVTCRILVPRPKIEPESPCIRRGIFNHGTTREVPRFSKRFGLSPAPDPSVKIITPPYTLEPFHLTVFVFL